MSTKITLVILTGMFLLMFASILNDSATMDELAHIPSGYGYVSQLDYRLNPEHPPLLKTLSGLSAWIFVNPNFPTDTKAWRDDINGQWTQGAVFLYESGNDADQIVFWSRIPFLLLTILLGWLIFDWTRKRFNTATALMTLLLFAFSPTILAHSRYVTTDLGAAFGFFIGFIGFLKFLEVPNRKNLLIAGLLFGTAQLLKFSLILLIPMYVLMIVGWIVTRPNLHLHERIKLGMRISLKTMLLGIVGFALVWIVYIPHVWNYPKDRQYNDADLTLTSFGLRPAVNLNLALIDNKYTRPFGQYMLGVLMVQQRAAGGNTAYFLDEVSAKGSRIYFPLLYLIKENLALHILTLIALIFAFYKFRKSSGSITGRARLWIYNHFAEFSALTFIIFYWLVSIKSPLNIGVRHVLPTFPFIYILVSRQIVEWLKWHETVNPQSWLDWFRNVYQLYIKSIPKYLFVGVLMLWLIGSSVAIFPNYLSYYNELSGGTSEGYKIAVDSNYDWGQDLKRLTDFVRENQIEKISVDYFGGGNPRYYLGGRFEPWWSARGPAHGWFAISGTFLQGAHGKTAPGFIRKPEDSYEWLKGYEPVARAGYSIFIYKLP